MTAFVPSGHLYCPCKNKKTVHDDTKSAARHAALCIDFHANQAATFTFQKVFRQLVVSGEFQKNSQEEVKGSQACAVTMTTWSPDLAPATDTNIISHQIVSAGRISQAGGGFYHVNG